MSLTREQIAERLKRIRVRGNIPETGAPHYNALSAVYREAIEKCPVERMDLHAADAVLALIAEARAEERERCAKVCDEQARNSTYYPNIASSARECAYGIRALGAPGEPESRS